jgi:hypothetical protein
MQPLAVDLKLLRDVLLPEVRIAPGRMLAARVVAAENGRGSLSIAGYLIEAELPKHVRPGQELRLEVRDVNAQRVLLQISDPSHVAVPAAPTQIPLPGGGTLTITERDPGGGAQSGEAHHGLSLRFDAPTLGPLDLRLDLDPATLRVGVAARAGASHEQASNHADELRAALEQTLSQAVSVSVTARRDPVDFYA